MDMRLFVRTLIFYVFKTFDPLWSPRTIFGMMATCLDFALFQN